MTRPDRPMTASTILLAVGLGLIGWAAIIAAGRALISVSGVARQHLALCSRLCHEACTVAWMTTT